MRFEADGTEKFPTAFFDVQTLTVHHTVTANSDPDPAATVRAIYFFHCVTSDFGDIGYHLLIDQAGTVYEGRYSGPDPIPVFGPRSVGPRPSMVNAAHVGGFNAGNVGVALLGDLTSTGPTAAARQALVSVLATLAQLTARDPLGTTNYVNPISGATRTVPTLAGHRDWAADRVPGQHLLPDSAERSRAPGRGRRSAHRLADSRRSTGGVCGPGSTLALMHIRARPGSRRGPMQPGVDLLAVGGSSSRPRRRRGPGRPARPGGQLVGCSAASVTPAWAAPVRISSASSAVVRPRRYSVLCAISTTSAPSRGHLAEPDEDVVTPVPGRADPEQQPPARRAGCRS